MMPNSEFIKSRSIEISWAIFRCAELIKQPKLKAELEGMAVNLVANFDHFVLENGQVELPHFHKLVALIKLAEAINEIKLINAQVLYRELTRLEKVIKESIPAEKEKDVEIEGMFKELPEGVNLKKEAVFQNKKNNVDEALNYTAPKVNFWEVNSAEGKNSLVNSANFIMADKSAKEVKEKLIGNNIGSFQSMPNLVMERAKRMNLHTSPTAAQFKNTARQDNSGNKRDLAIIDSAKKLPAIKKEDLIIQDSWQSKIYAKIKESGEASTRELANSFPEISERTVRFYLQRLCESKLIDKIGSTGPGSYYKYKD